MAPAGCPAVRFGSDTVYQELAPAPTGYGLSIIRPPPTKAADGKWGVPGLPTTPVLLATDQRFPRCTHLPERLTGHGRAVCLLDCRCSVMSNPSATPWTEASPGSCLWHFPGQNTGLGCHSLLQGIFPTQGLHHVSCIGRQVLYAQPPGKPLTRSPVYSKRIQFSDDGWPMEEVMGGGGGDPGNRGASVLSLDKPPSRTSPSPSTRKQPEPCSSETFAKASLRRRARFNRWLLVVGAQFSAALPSCKIGWGGDAEILAL